MCWLLVSWRVVWVVSASSSGGLNLKRDGHLGYYPLACSRRDVHFSSNPTYRYSTQLFLGFLRGEVSVIALYSVYRAACKCDYVHVFVHYVSVKCCSHGSSCLVCVTNDGCA